MSRASSLAPFHLSFVLVAAGLACTQLAPGGGSGGAGGSGGSGGDGGDDGDGTTGGGGATTTSNPFFTDPPEGTFPCGDVECAAATEACVLEADGMCCGQHHGCAPLPTSCGDLEPGCECVEEMACPCGGGCGGSVLVSCQRDPETGVFNFTCGNP